MTDPDIDAKAENIADGLCTPVSRSANATREVWPTDEQVWDSIRLTFDEKTAARLSFKRWKDGIDIDIPTAEVMLFAKQMFAMGITSVQSSPTPQIAEGVREAMEAALRRLVSGYGEIHDNKAVLEIASAALSPQAQATSDRPGSPR